MPDREPSYCLGNSRQLLQLTDEERAFLNTRQWVFACNNFPSHWRILGFAPTVWVYGDNHSLGCVADLAKELAAIAGDEDFQSRLRLAFYGLENCAVQADDAVAKSGVQAIGYRRGHWSDTGQKPARMGEPIFHHGTTFTDLINFAAIFNPGQEIRILGAQWNHPEDDCGHFYEPMQPNWRANRVISIWPGIAMLAKAGLPIVDCHTRHGSMDGHPEFVLPKKKLMDL